MASSNGPTFVTRGWVLATGHLDTGSDLESARNVDDKYKSHGAYASIEACCCHFGFMINVICYLSGSSLCISAEG